MNFPLFIHIGMKSPSSYYQSKHLTGILVANVFELIYLSCFIFDQCLSGYSGCRSSTIFIAKIERN